MLQTEGEIGEQFARMTSAFLQKCTVQLFRTDIEEGIVAHGTAILFTYRNNFFLITASHNFVGEDPKSIRIRVGPHLEKISNSVLKFSKETGSLAKDKIDLAVLWFNDSELIACLHKYNTFIELQDLRIDHEQKVVTSHRKDSKYILFGFPGSRTKQKFGVQNAWNVKALYIEVMLKQFHNDQIELPGFVGHLAFDRPTKGMNPATGSRTSLPKFKGLSGGGLWDIIGIDPANNMLDIRLVGIFIELSLTLGFATRIDFAIELIRSHFGLATLPASSFIRDWRLKYGGG